MELPWRLSVSSQALLFRILSAVMASTEIGASGSRIIGGKEASPHKYPSMVALASKFGFVDCGATILNRHWIMTSARCVVRTPSQDIKVLVGAHNISKEEVGRQTLSVVETLVHDKYDLTRGLHDIAVLRVEPPIIFRSTVIPVNLPPCKSMETGEAWATGWGFTGEEGVFNPKVLSEIKQNVISNEECKPMLAPVLENLGKTRLCVSHGDGGISIGDKGGPLYMVKDDGKMYQVGIASLLPGECAKNPGIFTRVSYYVGWIHRRISRCGNHPSYYLSTRPPKGDPGSPGKPPSNSRVQYNGYRVQRITPESADQVEELRRLSKLGARFWTYPGLPGRPVDVMFPPKVELPTSLRSAGVKIENMVEDVQKLIDSTEGHFDANAKLSFGNFSTVEQIYAFLFDLAEANSSVCEVIKIGMSYEGRDLLVLKIASGGTSPKPIIWLDSLIHAREWITGAVLTFMVNEILNGAEENIRSWLNDFDFYAMPVHNPDGYAFTHTNDRMWRKSRSPLHRNNCVGVDINRNWDYKWLAGSSEGDPCDEAYGGCVAFSEPETRAVRDFLNSIKDRLVAYISLHSYGQYILFPWAYTKEQNIPQYDLYKSIAADFSKAAATRRNITFQAGTPPELLYPAGGSSMDWVKKTHNTNLTWAFELQFKGKYGFIVPPEEIVPCGQEFLDGFHKIVEALRKGVPTPPLQ